MRNYCYSIVGYFDGLGLDPADISPQDMLELGVCYQGMPGCRKRTGFIPMEQITLEDTDPLYRELVEQNSLVETDPNPEIDCAFTEEVDENDDQDETERWDHHVQAFTDLNPWSPSDMDLIEMDVDHHHAKQIQRSIEEVHGSWDIKDRSRKRVDHPLRENRRHQPPTHQILIQEDPPLL